MSLYKLATQVLHAGKITDQTKSCAVPLHRTTAYLFNDTKHAADLFALKESGNIYSRLTNPTQEILENRMTILENGKAALALASGTAAIFYSIINICRNGDEIIAGKNLYGGTHTMFQHILPDFGITTKLVDIHNPEEIQQNINEKTKLIYTEVLDNPTLEVADLEMIAKIAEQYHLPLVVDSTFTPPYIFKPLDYGANIVIHSLTKWLGGHGNGLGGIVIDGGNFDWSDPKFPLYNEPDASYHGIRYAHDLQQTGLPPFIIRMRLVALRNLGACISPDNAWIFLQGIETFALRMQRHCENAQKVAEYLKNSSQVKWVRYPGLPNDPAYHKATKQFKNGFGGIVVFGLHGDSSACQKFIEKLQLFSHVSNVGDAKSLATHPSSTTHSQLSLEEQESVGISPNLIRLSIGIEDIDDIIVDLEQALS